MKENTADFSYFMLNVYRYESIAFKDKKKQKEFLLLYSYYIRYEVVKKAYNSGAILKPLNRGHAQAQCNVKTKYFRAQCV